jgi:protein-tyrosine phosphatase
MSQPAERVAVRAASPTEVRSSLGLVDRLVRYALTNSVAMAVKEPIKDFVWTVRGRQLANPAPPSTVRSLLFVCKGNICRSPFAAKRVAQLLGEAGSSITCASAGIETTQAGRSPREACEAAQTFGVRLDTHTPVQLTVSLVSRFDLIVVMEAAQLWALRRSYPDAADRIWLLSLLDERSGYARYHIADPFGGPLAGFESCYQRIDDALRRLLHLNGIAHCERPQ